MKADLLYTLYKIVERGSFGENVPVTTSRIAKSIGTSQQTASRRLMDLEDAGLIRRVRIPGGESVQVTEEGKRELNAMYLALRRIFEPPPRQLVLMGELFSGVGEGAYYIRQSGYRRQFTKKLGYDPFPGTLNVRLDKRAIGQRALLDTVPFIQVEGFNNGKRTYGPVKCYSVSVNGMAPASIVTAMRSHYGDDILEIIAPINLREKLRLRDGDKVTVKVFPSSG